mmetsp:Transcript_100456/g.324190  ORF Transcript_100456/g.324190 Transcript_100456/m.324190 type:complete len:255 (+) Transcript_100456:279-1043(+)
MCPIRRGGSPALLALRSCLEASRRSPATLEGPLPRMHAGFKQGRGGDQHPAAQQRLRPLRKAARQHEAALLAHKFHCRALPAVALAAKAESSRSTPARLSRKRRLPAASHSSAAGKQLRRAASPGQQRFQASSSAHAQARSTSAPICRAPSTPPPAAAATACKACALAWPNVRSISSASSGAHSSLAADLGAVAVRPSRHAWCIARISPVTPCTSGSSANRSNSASKSSALPPPGSSEAARAAASCNAAVSTRG